MRLIQRTSSRKHRNMKMSLQLHHLKPSANSAKMKKIKNETNRPLAVLIVCFLLIALIWGIFGQTLRHTFINYDDDTYVSENPEISCGITPESLHRIITKPHLLNWHPLTSLTNLIDCEFYGLNPAGHHATNVLLHTATALALFLVLRNLTGAFWRSALVAALFAVHPLRVESVAWVAERKDVLSGLFFMLTLGAYARYARRPFSIWRYAVVVVLFVAGLMSKSMLVTLPFVLLLLDFWPLGRFGTGSRAQGKHHQLHTINHPPLFWLVLEKIPLLLLSLLFCAITIWAQQEALHFANDLAVPLPWRLANAIAAYAIYLRQTILPYGLALLYPHPETMLPLWIVGLSLLTLAGISWVGWAQRKTRPQLLIGWLWYLGMLVPVIGILQVGEQSHADRYTYLPQIGILIAGVWLAAEALGQKPGRRTVAKLFAAILLATLSVLSYRQTAIWKNSQTLWQNSIQKTQKNHVAYNGLAVVFLNQRHFDKAMPLLRKALEIRPRFAAAHYNLGVALDLSGQSDESAEHLVAALQLSIQDVRTREHLGRIRLKQNRLDEAVTHLRLAAKDQPNSPEVLNNLGRALVLQGRFSEAIAHLERALMLNPSQAEAHYNLGLAFEGLGRLDEAIRCYEKTLGLSPNNAEVHQRAGTVLSAINRPAQALPHFEAALQAEPQSMEATLLLACVLVSLEDYSRAIPLLETVLIALPDLAAAHLFLGTALEALERPEEALVHYGAALKDNPDIHEKIALLQVRLGNPAQAVAHFEEMLRIQPQNVSAQNNLAWLMATSFDKTVRNPARAVELAEATDRQTKGTLPGLIDTLAAAYAAAGRFPEAIAAAQRALKMLPPDSAAASELQNRLKLYEAHTAYIEPEPPQKGAGGTP
jgi:tetratricopeptide (TPR) repeat protein